MTKYTRFLSLLLAAVLLLTALPAAFAATPTGDLDDDGLAAWRDAIVENAKYAADT